MSEADRGPVVEVVRDRARLEELAPAWTELVDRALIPNSFYEPWMVLPAVRHFGLTSSSCFLFVWERDPTAPERLSRLIGFFPLEQKRLVGLPFRVWQLWRYPFCYLCAPLVDQDVAPVAVAAWFDWLRAGGRRPSLVRMTRAPGDGAFPPLVLRELWVRGWSFHVADWYPRAMFVAREGAERYLEWALEGKRRKDFRRQWRALEGLGSPTFHEVDQDELLDPWLDSFLTQEAAGWKGKARAAMLSRPESAAYFREVAAASVRSGRGELLALRLGGRAIAHRWSVFSGDGGFALKVTYDEGLARYSPGTQLEIEAIRRMHERPGLRWMDSCASRNRFSMNHLWPDRRTIQAILFATDMWGSLLLACLPILKWVSERWKPRRTESEE